MKLVAIGLMPLALAACVTADAPSSLAGSSWRFTSIDGAAVVATDTSLQFGERLSANVGCNGLSGPWRVEGGRLIAGPLVATRMFCEGKMEREAAVSALLSGSPTISVAGEILTLSSGTHSAELRRTN